MSNVLRFGAVGDGVTDDTEAIKHAVANGDGMLHFPPGTYRITRPIEINLAKRGPLVTLSSKCDQIMKTFTSVVKQAGVKKEQFQCLTK